MANTNVSLDVIDPKAVNYFIAMSIYAGRLSPSAKADDIETTLDNLRLLDDEGHLKYAALLLFAKCPQRYFPGVQFKIGRFGRNAADLMFDDVVEGNILQMVDRVIELLKSKYLISPVSYEGLRRTETLEIPIIALREMLYNAVVHKEYPGVPIQMWVFNDHIELWNPGNLPKDYTVEMLLSKHSSVPRNQNIANVFYKAEFIETWGRGIEKICEEFEKAGMESPTFEQTQGGVLVTIMRKNSVDETKDDPKDDPKNVTKDVGINVTKDVTKDLSERQCVILELVSKYECVTIPEMSRKTKVTERTIKRDIDELMKKGILSREGGRKEGRWVINLDSKE